jgi:hypothetical protein
VPGSKPQKPCLGKIDVCPPTLIASLRPVQRPHIKRFGHRQMRFASLALALDGTALDSDQMRACLNAGASVHQQIGDSDAAVPSDRTSLPPSTRPAAALPLVGDWACTGWPVPTKLSPNHAAAATMSGPGSARTDARVGHCERPSA